MAEPKIVFCSKNHIYDAAIYDECPYCKKIQEEQIALSKNIELDNYLDSNMDRASSGYTSDEADATEMIDREDESTELIRVGEFIEQDDATEMMRRDEPDLLDKNDVEKEDKINAQPIVNEIPCHMEAFKDSDDNYVLGWLVFRNGQQKGNSIVLRQRPNYIYKSKGTVFASECSNLDGTLLASISKKKDDFLIHPCQNVQCGINGIVGTKDLVIRNYDLLSIEQHKFTFVELLTEFVDWGK